MVKTQVSTAVLDSDVRHLAKLIRKRWGNDIQCLVGVPRGGYITALSLSRYMAEEGFGGLVPVRSLPEIRNLSTWDKSTFVIVDDIYDSGKTLNPFIEGRYRCASLYSKNSAHPTTLVVGRQVVSDWLIFPWESEHEGNGPEDAVRRLLQFIGEDPDDPRVEDTPRRYLAWLAEFARFKEVNFNYSSFTDEQYGGMVLVRDIPFTSLCEHHLLPYSGEVSVAYISDTSVLGLSKLARIVQHEASRLSTQEALTANISEHLLIATGSTDVAVIMEAEHSCMAFRGPKVPGHSTVTSKLTGAFYSDATTRAEFMALARRT